MTGARTNMSTSEAAELFQCTRQNVHDLYQRGLLEAPSREPRAAIRLYVDSVEAYASARRRPTTSAHRTGIPTSESTSTVEQLAALVERLVSRVAQFEELLSDTHRRDQEHAKIVGELNALRAATVEADETGAKAKQARRSRDEILWTLIKEAAPTSASSAGASP